MTVATAKTKNKLRNTLLNYGAHVSVSHEYGNKEHSGESFPWDFGRQKRKCAFRKGAQSGVHKQITVLRGLADVVMLMDRLFARDGRLLVVNGADSAFQIRGIDPAERSTKLHTTNSKLYAMEGEWINGSCSNWSTLCKVAWNSYLLKKYTHSAGMPNREDLLNSWVSQASSTFSNLHLFSKVLVAQSHRLAYKRKPDCVLLINPEERTIEECKGLAIPLCMLSVTYPFAAATLSLEANRKSCFFVYLLFHIISYYTTKSMAPLQPFKKKAVFTPGVRV